MIIKLSEVNIYMKAIFASKLYKASRRKDKIRAALDNPINAELVQQLRVYLDDEYINKDYLEPDDPSYDSNSDSDNKDTRSIDKPPISPKSPTPVKFHPNSPLDIPDNPMDGDDPMSGAYDDGENDKNSSPEDNSNMSDNPNISESSNLNGENITSQTSLYKVPEVLPIISPDVVSEIKGTLNMRQDTSGVNRVLYKDDSEIWVYYNDKINLNNVMGPVIELLNASGYTYLDFNRLARTDNAIVFQVYVCDTSSNIEPIGSSGNHGKE